ncbi:unnamed protein product, partial [Didymodactylos carnosus]
MTPKLIIVQQFYQKIEQLLLNIHEPNSRNIPFYNQHHHIINTLKKKIFDTKTIIRKTDKSKVLHLGTSKQYQLKSEQFMDKTQAYKIIDHNPLYDIISQITHCLRTWLTNKYITSKQYEKLLPVRRKCQLAHLYYQPKAHKQGTPLRSICASINSPTAPSSQFLDNLLRPLFKQSTPTSIENGIYLVQQLKSYSRSEPFTPKTIFITFDIIDLYTMLNQNRAIFYLRRFLQGDLQLTALDGIPVDV